MTNVGPDLASGKGHRDENFPVASVLLSAEHRAPIMAFYRFARAADDIADHESATPEQKLARLAFMRAGLDGAANGAPEALALRNVMAERGLDAVHARDLLVAFERDVTVDRCVDWAALIDYCRYSAMPVGRFVLDVHGEDRAIWPANDALCAALQVVNHLQDCGKDYRTIRRVYLPLDTLAEHGARVEDLDATHATPALRSAIVALAGRTRELLAQSAPFARLIRDRKLAAEVAVIQRLAESLAERLEHRDPLSERVHHGKAEAALLAARAALPVLFRRAA
ncbi:squalene synthase HpnC [Sphingomonas sp. Leaf357]|uniref:squalene synthase HpnC n=1 Tax=Sphingomonas sp. Leaf357 TaxID=1736350 RepID=UPI0006F979D8|nr:squalene synthase HpnC [Sphingomonas sp. Leaf357]KQS01312.1 squalene synthase HpnC [Sphingomonas sp. Leaf357]